MGYVSSLIICHHIFGLIMSIQGLVSFFLSFFWADGMRFIVEMIGGFCLETISSFGTLVFFI